LHPTYLRLGGAPCREYYSLIPPGSERLAPLVLVHGISRNAAELVIRFAPFAEKFGVPLIAPLFRKAEYGMYQQMLDQQAQAQSDVALFDILDDARLRWGLDVARFALFGFSGGGQFAHRFAILHPDRLTACMPASAGWYTWPDESVQWPHGLGGAPRAIDREALRRLPIHVIVGERDTEMDEALRRSRKIDGLQGLHRLERARRWHQAMQASGLAPLCTLSILEGARHSFDSAYRRGLVRLVSSLLGHPTDQLGVSR
jgi:pimeloyl-ACP methyl ester carboxylesterase